MPPMVQGFLHISNLYIYICESLVKFWFDLKENNVSLLPSMMIEGH